MGSRDDLEFLNPHEQEPIEQDEPTTLTECMQYAKDNDDFEPLECAIYTTEKNVSEAEEFIKTCIDETGYMTNGIMKSRFKKILTILNRK